jgi:predicted GNAT family N-acyltransferase
MITYRTISTNDPAYEQEKDLRNRVLRLPLGLTLSDHDMFDDDKQVHIIALDGPDRVVGCVLIGLVDNSARARQMAVEDAYRGRGIGSELMRQAEQAASARRISAMTLHARLSAKAFYEHLGYAVTSDVFTEVTIPHVAMNKDLIAHR